MGRGGGMVDTGGGPRSTIHNQGHCGASGRVQLIDWDRIGSYLDLAIGGVNVALNGIEDRALVVAGQEC